MTISAGDTVFVVYQYSPGSGVSIDNLDVTIGVYRRWGDAVRKAEEVTGEELEEGEDEIQAQPDLYVAIMPHVIQ